MLVHGRNSARNILSREVAATTYDENAKTVVPYLGSATTQQSVVSDALADTGVLWFLSLFNVTADTGHGSPLSDQSDALHTIGGNYSQPYSTAVCIPDQIQDASDMRPVGFPLLINANPPEAANSNLTIQISNGTLDHPMILHPDLFYSQLSDSRGNDHEYMIKWIDFQKDLFPGSSIGAAILLPVLQPEAAQTVLLCNIAAGWAESSVSIETSSASSGLANSTLRKGNDTNHRVISIEATGYPPAEQGAGLGSPFHYPYLPLQLINISSSWAEFLNPLIEDQNTSLINVLMQQIVGPGAEAPSAQEILAILTVNGLARTSWDSVIQGDVKTVGPNGQEGLDGNYWLSGKGDVFENIDPADAQKWVTFRVDSDLEGYAYNVLTKPPRVAIAILTIYCILVVGHTIYSGISGKFLFFNLQHS